MTKQWPVATPAVIQLQATRLAIVPETQLAVAQLQVTRLAAAQLQVTRLVAARLAVAARVPVTPHVNLASVTNKRSSII
jgi:hypothetical protein